MHGTKNDDASLESPKQRAVEEITGELRAFEATERRRLGLDVAFDHWWDPNPREFTKSQRAQTTVLFGGLSAMHDAFVEAGMVSLGYRCKALDCPDKEALEYGKEFGNRAQCNPTYFTAGNLLKYLIRLRDVEGMTTEDIVSKHVFLTLSSCGPCRFGTYVTEYRKALRDAGFSGFRIFDLKAFGPSGKKSGGSGFEFGAQFYIRLVRWMIAADVVNLMGYRTRPYEVVEGATDAALEQCKVIVRDALLTGRSLRRALRACRALFAEVAVERLRPKPKVTILGEFWAMTTEGDGNYRLQRFLESEGAECEIPILTNQVLYEIWCQLYDTRERMMLRRRDGEKHQTDSDAPLTTLFFLRLIKFAVERCFFRCARAIGLKNYRLHDMDRIARVAHKFYPNQLRGGEGHQEVGMVIEAVNGKEANMVISVKPFGCMPSSAVSDGVQSLVTARYPEAIFCPIETTGDGAVSAHSRVQMALFKARIKALEEYEEALAAIGLSVEEANRRAAGVRELRSAVHYPPHVVAGTAANAVYELART